MSRSTNDIKPYGDVITFKAKTSNGFFRVHKQDDRYFFEIADSLLGRDILVVNRALTPLAGDVVVAEVDNAFTVKYLRKRAGKWRLCAADPTFPDVIPRDGQQLVVCGVVTAVVKRLRER